MNFNFKVGERVEVLPTKPNGEAHPFAGKRGWTVHVHSMILMNAYVQLDDVPGLAVISLASLKHLTLAEELATRGKS